MAVTKEEQKAQEQAERDRFESGSRAGKDELKMGERTEAGTSRIGDPKPDTAVLHVEELDAELDQHCTDIESQLARIQHPGTPSDVDRGAGEIRRILHKNREFRKQHMRRTPIT
jgi:hypothetical protein